MQRGWGEGGLQGMLSCVWDVLPLVMADLYQLSPSSLICSGVLYPETLQLHVTCQQMPSTVRDPSDFEALP